MSTLIRSCLILAAALVAMAGVAQHGSAPTHGDTRTLDAQGSYPEWEQSPYWREFYALSVAALGQGADAVDAEAYEQRAYVLFREFARSIGADPDGIVAHLSNIPREMVAIVAADPTVLASYENFLVALRGPRD
jgi:hypothetical protein